jgi:hypothetical protein
VNLSLAAGQVSGNNLERPDLIANPNPGLDASLQKDAVLHDRAKIQFRLDVYNSLNHPNFHCREESSERQTLG